MQIAFPFNINERGRCAEASEDEHIRDLIEQTLFTSPGERVNRPDFGTGIMDFVFAPVGDEIMAATKHMVHGALQQNLADLVQIRDVKVEGGDAVLKVTVQYITLQGHENTATFKQSLTPGI